ncbi:IS3 family transposase [Aedoeadaptatus acetigenes]|uniref:IS3 family transposase n=1 Tax=Aedoeadaptatus acetigenes TaxID=2981723 RepID=UPI0011DD1677|nr:IS3 family transposase [Aedoeadaptatus acetigenes]MCU6786190.1 IS3 family transposase [Aedoeadaptatus acetigenes]
MTIDVDRYKVRNGNDSNPGNVTEEKESEVEDFIECSKMVLGVLGYKLFVAIGDRTPKESSKNNNGDKELLLYLSRKSGKSNRLIEGKCKRTDEGFVVLKDSVIEIIDSAIPKSTNELRKECINKNKIIDGRVSKNYIFNSTFYAAAFVFGTDAPTENFFSILKREIYVGHDYQSRGELERAIDRFIRYYNNDRIKKVRRLESERVP